MISVKFLWLSTDGQGSKWRRNIAKNFNHLSRCTSVTDRQTDRQMTDGRATAYSEHEHEFTFAKTKPKPTLTCKNCSCVRTIVQNCRTQHRTILTILSLILQTVIIAQIMSTGEETVLIPQARQLSQYASNSLLLFMCLTVVLSVRLSTTLITLVVHIEQSAGYLCESLCPDNKFVN